MGSVRKTRAGGKATRRKTAKKAGKKAARKAVRSAAKKGAKKKKAAPAKRAGKKRAAGKAAAAGGKTGPRKRSIPAPDIEVDADVLEFIEALDRYKRHHNRPFPSWSEVLHVLRSLGYRKEQVL